MWALCWPSLGTCSRLSAPLVTKAPTLRASLTSPGRTAHLCPVLAPHTPFQWGQAGLAQGSPVPASLATSGFWNFSFPSNGSAF